MYKLLNQPKSQKNLYADFWISFSVKLSLIFTQQDHQTLLGFTLLEILPENSF
jgi:hypothetical protein